MASQNSYKGVSRVVFQVARAFELSSDQVERLSRSCDTIATLQQQKAEELARLVSIPLDTADGMVETARLLALPGIEVKQALDLHANGLTLQVLATSTVDALAKKLKSVASFSDANTASIKRQAALQSGKPIRPKAAVKPHNPLITTTLRKVVLDQSLSWPKIAARFYEVTDGQEKRLAGQLAVINGMDASKAVRAGAVLSLPKKTAPKRKLPAPASSVKQLMAFSPGLEEAEARRLVDAGVVEPRTLAFASNVKRLSAVTGMDSGTVFQLHVQASLATLPQVSAELAYYLARIKPRTLESLARTKASDLALELQQAIALNYLPEDQPTTSEVVTDLLIVVEGFLIDIGKWLPIPEETSVCESALPTTTHLENFYGYRFSPQGRTSEMLGREIAAKSQWLTEASSALLSAATGSYETLINSGLTLSRLNASDIDIETLSEVNKLIELKQFVEDNLRIVQLLQALTEGHEAYRRREYGLSLAAYGRAQQWFDTIAPATSHTPDNQWWHNKSIAGIMKPAFLVNQETSTGGVNDTFVHGYYRVHEFYLYRKGADQPDTLLETLQVNWRDYQKWELTVSEDSERPSFNQFLYYVHNFLLPICRADCLRRLGNYCEAIDLFLGIYTEKYFTGPLSDAEESDLAVTIKSTLPAAVRYATLSPYVMARSENQYYPAYLHAVEKRLVTLKVADTLLAWGDSLYRRDDPESAAIRYAQVLRVLNSQWKAVRDGDHQSIDEYHEGLTTTSVNPYAASLAMAAHQQLGKIAADLNYLGYSEDYVPVWTYRFLLNSARYFTERARQLGRDALQFLESAARELGNRRLLNQQMAIAEGQLAIETRRLAESSTALDITLAGLSLAGQRAWNSENRRQEFENFLPVRQSLGVVGGVISGAGSGASIGGAIGMGNPAGALVGLPIGATAGGISAYLSGAIEAEAQRNEFYRMSSELESAKRLSATEVNRARIGVDIARLTRAVAALNVIFAQSNIEFSQSKTLNADFWYAASHRMSDLAEVYLGYGIGSAFLAEQAYEFMEGRRLDVIRTDYAESGALLAADVLLADLDSIEYERISSRERKSVPIKYIVSLREKDFQAFSELKRTGRLTFETSLFDFDTAHPGTFQQRIRNVEVVIYALTRPEGIRGTLWKSGLSYLRYPTANFAVGDAPPNTAEDWISYTPSDYRLAPVLQKDETMILSPFNIRNDRAVLGGEDGEQLDLFEGSGVGTSWTLTVDPCTNNFDLGTITEVTLVVYLTAQFDPRLEETIALERRKQMALGELIHQRSRGFSLHESFPDGFYHFHNPIRDSEIDTRRERTIPLYLDGYAFPPNQVDRRLKGVTIAFVGDDGYIDVTSRLTKENFIIPESEFQSEDSGPVKVADGKDHPLDGQWLLTIPADTNPGLTDGNTYAVDANGDIVLDDLGQPVPDSASGVRLFDADQIQHIKDIWIIFRYDYDLPGPCGEPIVLWTDFNTDSTVAYVAAGIKKQSSLETVDLQESSHWRRSNGFLMQEKSAGESILRPVDPIPLDTFYLETVIRLNNREANAGIVFFDDSLNTVGDIRLQASDPDAVTISYPESDSHAEKRIKATVAVASLDAILLGIRRRDNQLAISINHRAVLAISLKNWQDFPRRATFGLYAKDNDVGFGYVRISKAQSQSKV